MLSATGEHDREKDAHGEPPRRDLIVIGASAGGLQALMKVVGPLPASLPASVLVVVHVSPSVPSVLPHILARVSKLHVAPPYVDAELALGTLYVAPADHHLTLRGNRVHLSHGPPVNRSRPSIDVLFDTAARAAGARVIGLVLSGMLDDGTAGMLAIQRAGGLTLVQDPADALYGGMPSSVLSRLQVDHMLPATRLGEKLLELAGQPVRDGDPRPRPGGS